jgi:plastocyanin
MISPAQFRCMCRMAGLLVVVLLACAMAQAGEIKGKVTAAGLSSAKNIVVYVDTIPGKTFNPPTQPVTMDQKHLEFVPHVLAVLKGTTVNFLNSDATLHNVFWPSIGGNRKLARNLGTWPQGQHKSFTFDNLGAAPLLCNVHPEMPGKYTLKTWSEQGKPTTQEVDVTGASTTADLTVHR